MAFLSLRIYQKINRNEEFSILLENKKQKESLLFQSGTVISLGRTETDAIRNNYYSRITDVYGCLGVLQMCPRENTQLYLVVVTRCIKVCNVQNTAICKVQEIDIISLQSLRSQNYKPQDDETWIKELKKLLGNESFYFSVATSADHANFDITLCAQKRAKGAPSDNKFFWNRMLHLHLKRFNIDCEKWLLKAMCGSVEYATIYMNNHTPKIFIISRLSCERAGTRFNVRGVNDAGHVANFVETEQIIHIETLDDLLLSYVQIRGTVPLFWEQPGLNVGSHRVKMSREPEISIQAFWRHCRYIREKYGKHVVLNLLGTGVTGKRQGEAALSHLFQLQHLNCKWSKGSAHIVFDFHQECSRGATVALNNKLRPQIMREIEEFGFFCARNGNIEQIQTGVMRTNCLDCLDRTNRVQNYLGLDILRKKLEVIGVLNNGIIVQRFTSKLDEMWKDNGNRISLNYAGTGALQGSKIIDGARSAGRMIQNNLLDNNKQEAIDLLLHGNLLNNYLATLCRTLLPAQYLCAPFSILSEVCGKSDEFCDRIKLRVAVGTYNVNGGKHFRSLAYKNLSLDDWLLDSEKNAAEALLIDTSPTDSWAESTPADIYAIGFEEIVDLTAQNIVQNTQSSENAKSWGRELQKVISRDQKYVMVTWKQLVGVALFVYVHQKHAGAIRDVAVETVKTGLQGATGNKGACGIRMVLGSTSFAFVCSHFAAGQKEVSERNADYDTIARKMIFNLGVPLWAHDYVFWCGDFNYRINTLSRDEIISNVQKTEWSLLLEHDQLRISQQENKCFKGFHEGEINFPPTYKYDLFSDDYDTSEKQRNPAWTDRVLFWARQYPKDKNDPNWSPGKILHYGRAELKQSDHRPVLAIIEIDGRKIDPEQRRETYESVVENMGPTDCSVVLRTNDLETPISDPEILQTIKNEMEEIDSVVIVRSIGEEVQVTFKNSKSCLEAVNMGTLTMRDISFTISLKTEDWRSNLEEELNLCVDSAVPLTDENNQDFDNDNDEEAEITLESVDDVMEEFYDDELDQLDPENFEDRRAVTPEIFRAITPEPVAAKPSRPAPPKPVPTRPAPPAPKNSYVVSSSTVQASVAPPAYPAPPAPMAKQDRPPRPPTIPVSPNLNRKESSKIELETKKSTFNSIFYDAEIALAEESPLESDPFGSPKDPFDTQEQFENKKALFETQKLPFETEKDSVETQKDLFESQKDSFETQKDPVEIQEQFKTQKDPFEIHKNTFDCKKDLFETQKYPFQPFENQKGFFETQEFESKSLGETQQNLFETHKNQFKTQKDPFESQKDQFKTQKNLFESQKDPFKTQKDPFESQKDSFKTQIDPFESQKDSFETQKDPFESQKDPFKIQKDLFESQKDQFKTQNDPFESQKDQFETPKDQFKTQNDPFESQKDPFKTQKNQFKTQNDPFETQKDQFKTPENLFESQKMTQQMQLKSQNFLESSNNLEGVNFFAQTASTPIDFPTQLPNDIFATSFGANLNNLNHQPVSNNNSCINNIAPLNNTQYKYEMESQLSSQATESPVPVVQKESVTVFSKLPISAPMGPPPSIPPRGGTKPTIAGRSLPPVPARTLPPVPPRK